MALHDLSRAEAVAHLADRVAGRQLPHPTRVAIDGVTAAGKTTLAGELAAALAERGRPVIRVSMDGFHHPRAHRHRQGRGSARGYYEDAYNFDALANELLRPLGPGGDRCYVRRVIDLDSDELIDEPAQIAACQAVLVVDGTFLQRAEVRHLWDERVWVDTPIEVARARGVERDAALLGGADAAEALFLTRYHAAAEIYLAAASPAAAATVVFGNAQLGRARLSLA